LGGRWAVSAGCPEGPPVFATQRPSLRVALSPVHVALGALQRGYHNDACTGCATLAPAVREGSVYLRVGTWRGLGAARGAAETEAAEMPIDLGSR
jgi:hypothetical protein